MKKLLTIVFVLTISVALYAQQLSKVYALSEGGFSAGSSKLSVLDVQTNNFTQSIFSPGNIGLYPDGLIFHENYLYLTEQGNYLSSGKIYKLDTLGNVINSAVVGTNPYSLTIANSKIYLTNGPASNVTILNLNDFSFIKNVSVGVYPQEIISFNDKIFVANNSLFGGASDSTVSVIDPVLDSVVATIIVKKDPSSFAVSNDNFLFVGCPGDENSGKVFKINPVSLEIVESISIPAYGVGKDISVDKNSNDIFLIGYTNDIVKYNLVTQNSSLILSSVFPNNYYYGYGFDYTKKRHYVLDAKNFTVEGSMLIVDSTSTILSNYATGIAPRRLLFKYNGSSTDVNENYIVNSFNLEQNYPNPFNPTTKINWQSPVSGWQTLKVYDILGNEVATLVDEYNSAGNYSIDFSANNLASGIYIYSLTINDGKKNLTLSKKMTVLK
ncbi:MAG: T9SS type A sorting domain-containing protein [Ignavibacteriaceae bacterium]|nr:T9SS type A sorting domain-containing protein [Ignavibacteriaceae bacterium]